MANKTVDYKYLFGPVPSRRLGLSLGVDLVPFKTCSLDCVYCECGRTSNLTLDRREYVPLKEIKSELKAFLGSKPKLDYVTFSGSGEPTLHSGIGEIVRFLKENFPEYSIALITNSTTFIDPEVIEEVLPVDMILPSLDAASEEVFRRLNRPVDDLTVAQVIDGLVNLRKSFSGKIYLEIFIIPHLNDTPAELEKLKSAVQRIKPDIVQLNSLDRPGTESWVNPLAREKLERIADLLEWKTEIIARFNPVGEIRGYDFSTEQAILQILRRRPCTLDDLSKSLGVDFPEIENYLKELTSKNKIITEKMDRGVFYRALND